MNTKDNNRVNMIDATTGYCDAHTAATAGIPAFALRLADVKTKRTLINALNQIGMGNTKGVTADVNLLRFTMIKIALKCANATIAFANSTQNNTLLQLVNFNKSKLNKMAKADVDDACQAIHDAADANIAGVVNFGIVAGDVTDLQIAITVFQVASQNPRQAIITKREAIKDAKRLVREIIRDLLEGQMDKMANTLEETENGFWSGYFAARKIIDLGITYAKVSGTVFTVLDEPLEGVRFAVYETGTENLVKEVLTDSEGKFKTGRIAVGDFDFRFEKSGYQTKTESDVHVAAGKEVRRKVALVKSNAVSAEGNLDENQIANILLAYEGGAPGSLTTPVKLEAQGSTFRYYFSDTPGAEPTAMFVDVVAGLTVYTTVASLGAALGYGKFNVKNVGTTSGHWKVTVG